MKLSRLRPFIAITVLAVALVAAPQTRAQIDGSAPFSSAGTTSEDVSAFLVRLNKGVASNDGAAVAKLVSFPLRAWNGKTTVSIRNRQEFLAQYPKIFTTSLQQTIAAAKTEQAFANWQGVMFESGRFWIRPDDKGTLGIVTINPPTDAPAKK